MSFFYFVFIFPHYHLMSNLTMDENQLEANSNCDIKNEFVTIKSDKEVEQFLGQVVLIRSKSYYFCGSRKNHERYGFVSASPDFWQGGELGPNINLFYEPNEIHGNCALIPSEYKKN